MKHILMAVVLLLCASSAHACDACGSSMNGDGWGIMPFYSRHFIGIRTQYRIYHNTAIHNSETDLHQGEGYDRFLRSEVSMRYALLPRLQVVAGIPLRYNQHQENGSLTIRQGIGDIYTQINWLALLPKNCSWSHALQIGAGVEAPTGRFRFSHEIPSAMQTGSASWDYTGQLAYTLRGPRVGFNTEISGRLNGNTVDGYDWGNSFSTSARMFYQIKRDSTASFLPWIGVSYEFAQSNYESMDYKIRAAYTGGDLLLCTAGIDYYNQRLNAGLEMGLPSMQNLSDGMSNLHLHFGFKLIFFITSNSKKTL